MSTLCRYGKFIFSFADVKSGAPIWCGKRCWNIQACAGHFVWEFIFPWFWCLLHKNLFFICLYLFVRHCYFSNPLLHVSDSSDTHFLLTTIFLMKILLRVCLIFFMSDWWKLWLKTYMRYSFDFVHISDSL